MISNTDGVVPESTRGKEERMKESGICVFGGAGAALGRRPRLVQSLEADPQTKTELARAAHRGR